MKQKIAVHHTDRGPHTTTYYGSVEVPHAVVVGDVVVISRSTDHVLGAPVQFTQDDVAHLYLSFADCEGQQLSDAGLLTAVEIGLLSL